MRFSSLNIFNSKVERKVIARGSNLHFSSKKNIYIPNGVLNSQNLDSFLEQNTRATHKWQSYFHEIYSNNNKPTSTQVNRKPYNYNERLWKARNYHNIRFRNRLNGILAINTPIQARHSEVIRRNYDVMDDNKTQINTPIIKNNNLADDAMTIKNSPVKNKFNNFSDTKTVIIGNNKNIEYASKINHAAIKPRRNSIG